MNDEQKAQLEETQGGTPTGDYIISASEQEIYELIEEGNAKALLERIRHYSVIIEMMARALVNKTKE